ncbi:molecular chaperone DnaJ, partial [Mycobacterium tuberculosis]|nr:molecular chaperone DnaJ [Mycobacterium tuberculosis]
DTLKDPQKRAAYDRYGHAAFENGGFGGGAGFSGDFAQTMSDIFESFFGGDGGPRQRGTGGRERGADLRYNLDITLEEAYAGKQVEIK